MLAVWDHAREDSITIDEPLHIFGGAEYLLNGTMVTNPEHPPLAKDLAALSLMRAEIKPPQIRAVTPIPPDRELLVFFHRNRIPLEEIAALARAPFRWLLAALIVVVYVTARAAWGIRAAILASAIVALEPSLIAHAGLVHTDIPATLFMTLTVALTIASAGASPLRWILTGASLGLAIAAKFTALLLVPLVVLAPLLLLLEGVRGRKLLEQFAGAIAACIVAALVVMLVYTLNLTGMDPDEAAMSTSAFLRSRFEDPATVERYARLTKASPAIGMFLSGIRGVRLVSEGGYLWTFLHGRLSKNGFPHYFFVAFLVKSSLAMLFLTAAVFFGGRRLRSKWAIGLLAPVVTMFAATIPSAFNIGVRHILPVYPLLAIAGAGMLASHLPRRAFRVAATLLIVAAGLSLWRSHPHELGYFNAIAEGTGGGEAWLSDSNLDWAQDIGRLTKVLRERGWERDTTVEVFAAVVHWPMIARYRRLEGDTIPPGRYAVSAYIEQVRAHDNPRLEKLVETLHARGRRVQRVGSSITIWELR